MCLMQGKCISMRWGKASLYTFIGLTKSYRRSSFFCDCGAGSVTGHPCQALSNIDIENVDSSENPASPTPMVISTPAVTKSDPDSESDSESEASDAEDGDIKPSASITSDTTPAPAEVFASKTDSAASIGASTLPEAEVLVAENAREKLSVLAQRQGLARAVLSLYQRLQKEIEKERMHDGDEAEGDLFSSDKSVVVKPDALMLKRACPASSFEVRLKLSDGGQAKAVKGLLASNALLHSILAINSKSQLALAEGSQICLLDSSPLLQKKGSSSIDRSSLPLLSSTELKFDVVTLRFNPLNPSFLAVTGVRDCQILSFNSS